MERATRIGLATEAWEAPILPLNYARKFRKIAFRRNLTFIFYYIFIFFTSVFTIFSEIIIEIIVILTPNVTSVR